MQVVLDTTGKNILIILFENKKIIDDIYIDSLNKQSELALKKLNLLCKKNNKNLRDIKKMFIGIGPGSYSGIRVGITIARTLFFLNPSIIINGFNSMFIYNCDEKAFSFRDARSNKTYFLASDSGKIVEQSVIENKDIPEYLIKYKKFIEAKKYIVTNFFRALENIELTDLEANYIKEPNVKKLSS